MDFVKLVRSYIISYFVKFSRVIIGIQEPLIL